MCEVIGHRLSAHSIATEEKKIMAKGDNKKKGTDKNKPSKTLKEKKQDKKDKKQKDKKQGAFPE